MFSNVALEIEHHEPEKPSEAKIIQTKKAKENSVMILVVTDDRGITNTHSDELVKSNKPKNNCKGHISGLDDDSGNGGDRNNVSVEDDSLDSFLSRKPGRSHQRSKNAKLIPKMMKTWIK